MKRVLFIVSLDSLDVPRHLDTAITAATAAASDALIVVLINDAFTPSPSRPVQTILAHVYVVANQQNNLLDVSVLLRTALSPDTIPPDIDHCFLVHGNVTLPASIPHTFLPSLPRPSPSTIPLAPSSPGYPVVALGGTFDHLHAGHKILLSMAAWIATRKVIVGITVDALLKNKSNPHLLQSFQTRVHNTRSFLMLFRPDLDYQLIPLHDVYGPTASDPDIQALVVSKETLSGAAAIDKERARNGLPASQTFVIDVISSDSPKLDHEDPEILKQTKMSSTFIRQWIASNSPNSPS